MIDCLCGVAHYLSPAGLVRLPRAGRRIGVAVGAHHVAGERHGQLADRSASPSRKAQLSRANGRDGRLRNVALEPETGPIEEDSNKVSCST